jgi:hypothetical protein
MSKDANNMNNGTTMVNRMIIINHLFDPKYTSQKSYFNVTAIIENLWIVGIASFNAKMVKR